VHRLHRLRRPTALLLAAFGCASAALPAAGQDASSLAPACDGPVVPPTGCQVGAWPADGAPALPSAFGTIEPGVWITDPAGDAPAGGLDILGVGVGRVPVRDAARLRRAGDVLRSGNRRQAIRDGPALLIRTVLGSAPDALADGHGGVHVATDVDGVRSNDAPTGVDEPTGPFAGLQEVYSVSVAAGEKPDALFSDLARGWYKGRQPFAAHRPAPEVVDILVRPERFGEAFRVATFTEGTAGGGYDVAGIGGTLAPIPLDGRVPATPMCLEASVATEPFVVERLVENGQTFRDVETPRSWTGTARFAVTAEERSALERLIAAGDVDRDGAVELRGEAVLVEEGLNVRQTPRLSLGLRDDEAVLGVGLGLARRGFIVIRDIALEPTGDAAADAALGRAVDAFVDAVPPFRVARRSGPVLGSAAGPCLPAIGPGST
jgi:hypothetical protein